MPPPFVRATGAIKLAVASFPGKHPTIAEIQSATFTPCKVWRAIGRYIQSYGSRHAHCHDLPSTHSLAYQVGDTFGPSWATHWFRVEVHLPADYAGTAPYTQHDDRYWS